MRIFGNIGRTKGTEAAKSTAGSSVAAAASGSPQEVEPHPERQDKGVGDLPLKGPSAQTRLEQEPCASVQSSGMTVPPTSFASAPMKNVEGRGKKGADEHGAPPSRADERWKQPPRRASKALWAAVVLLALALSGVTGYGYLIVRQNGIALSQLPGMATVVGTLRSRMDATEVKLRDVTTDWASLSQQVAALNTGMRSGLQRARQRTEELIIREQRRIEEEMDKRDHAVNTRLAQIEAEQQAENQGLAQLQDWAQKNVDTVRQEIAGERQDRGRDLNALRQEVDGERGELQRLAQNGNRQRADFESAKNREQELVPGISLTVTGTDVRYQRFEGYLSLTEQGRFVRLSNVSAELAVPFYPEQGDRAYDLIVTTVNRDGVVGYLLVPKGENPGKGETASGAPAPGTQRSTGGLF